jgi:hypothetical protein
VNGGSSITSLGKVNSEDGDSIFVILEREENVGTGFEAMDHELETLKSFSVL